MRAFVFGLLVVFVGLCAYILLDRAPEVVRPEPVEEVEVLSPYRYGYESGYSSFLAQVGEEVPRKRVVMYATGSEDMEGEYSRGYVDGYHRATEGYSCPRGDCPY